MVLIDGSSKICYTQPKNIKDRLIGGKSPPARINRVMRGQENGFKRCNQSGCKLCPLVGEATNNGLVKSVRVSNTGEDYQIRGKLTCSSSNLLWGTNLLYLLTKKGDRMCPKTPQYGGETGQMACKRFTEHHGTVPQHCHLQTKKPVGQHFRLPGHSISDISFIPVEKILYQT